MLEVDSRGNEENQINLGLDDSCPTLFLEVADVLTKRNKVHVVGSPELANCMRVRSGKTVFYVSSV